MAKSNYDRWMEAKQIESSGDTPPAVPARGAGRRWTNRQGVTVEVLPAAASRLDADGMPWLACCVDHGSLLATPTKASAEASCRNTTEFCDGCREAADRRAK